MLTVSEVTKSYGGKTLFEEVTTSFEPGHRYGLTGANGAGKSTFMKILAGQLEPDKGTVSRLPRTRLSVLHQDHYRYEEDRIRDVVIMGNAKLWAAMSEKERLLASGDRATRSACARRARGHDRRGERLRRRVRGGAAARGARDAGGAAGAAAQGADRRHAPAGAAGAGAVRHAGHPAARRADQPPRPRVDPLAVELLDGVPRGAGRDLARPLLLERGLHAHGRRRLPEHHHVHGRLRRDDAQKIQYRISAEKGNASKQKKISELKEFIQRFGANAKKASQAQSRRRAITKIDLVDLKRSNIQRPFIRFDPKVRAASWRWRSTS
jgi:ATPase subunit of ABC transporter with duplicated ATPase domains